MGEGEGEGVGGGGGGRGGRGGRGKGELVITSLVAAYGFRGHRCRKADCDIMIPDKKVCWQHWTCSKW